MKKIQSSIFMLCIIAFASSCKYQFNDEEDPKPQKDPMTKLLTGNNDNGKTWRVCADPYQTKIYPKSYLTNTNTWPYWEFIYGLVDVSDKDGWLQNDFTFSSKNNQFIPKNQSVKAHWGYLNTYWGFNQDIYIDAAVVDPNHKQASFEFKNENTGIGTGYTIDIANNGYIGYLSNKKSKYYVMSLNKDTLRLAHLFQEYDLIGGVTTESGEPNVLQVTFVAK